MNKTGCSDSLIMSEDDTFIQMLDIMITLFTLCSTLQACFYSCFGEPTNRSAIIFDYFMEAFFLIDILKTFFL